MRWVSRFDDERSIVCLWLRIGESLTELLNGEALNELYPVIISGGSIVRGELLLRQKRADLFYFVTFRLRV